MRDASEVQNTFDAFLFSYFLCHVAFLSFVNEKIAIRCVVRGVILKFSNPFVIFFECRYICIHFNIMHECQMLYL